VGAVRVIENVIGCLSADAFAVVNEVELADVVAVVNSHLHFDHCGQNRMTFGTSTTSALRTSGLGFDYQDDHETPG
jgi:hypothetical protein